jgi:hypothetical protein
MFKIVSFEMFWLYKFRYIDEGEDLGVVFWGGGLFTGFAIFLN